MTYDGFQRRARGPVAPRIAATVLAGAAVLGGCGDEQQEIRAWMQEQRKSVPSTKETIAPPKRFEPFRYQNAALPDPFEQTRLAPKAGTETGGGLQPDVARRREALESFPLDSIRMVGHMSSGSSSFALLQVDNMVYQAWVGNYAGQNYGKIVRVTESEVRLKEMVQDAAGDWTERETALRLQEARLQEGKK